jgi:group I intron endonuclease
MSSLSKRPAQNSGSSSAKRQRLSSDEPDVLETKESEALIEQVDGDDTKCRTGSIYVIPNLITKKVYIGLTIREPEIRWQEHEYSGRNPKYHFHRSIKKHGWENFKPEILAENIPIEELGDLEMYYIDLYDSYNNGYNSTKGGEGTLGHLRTEEQRMAKSKRQTKNHSIEGGGSVFFVNKWKAIGCQVTGGKHIGSYFTKDKAIEALKLYNETGQCMPSDLLRRISGSGCVTYINRDKKWKATGSLRTGKKHIGYYFTKDKAIAALKLYNETGARMPSDVTKRRRGTGCITEYSTKKKGTIYRGQLKIKGKIHYTERYGSREKADFELEKLRSKLL